MINRPPSSNSDLRQRIITAQPRAGDVNQLDPRNCSGRSLTTTRTLQGPVVQQPTRNRTRAEGGLPVSSMMIPRSVQNVTEEPASNGCSSCCRRHKAAPTTLLPMEQQTAVADTANEKPNCCKSFWCCCCNMTVDCYYGNCTTEGLERQGPDMTRASASLCCFACADIVAGTATVSHMVINQSICGVASSGGAAGGAVAGIMSGSVLAGGAVGCCVGACCYNCCAKAAIKVSDAEGWNNKVDMAKEMALTSLTGAGSGNKKKTLSAEEKKEQEARRAKRQLTFKQGNSDLEGLNMLLEETADDSSDPVHEEHQGIPKLKF